MTSSYQLEMELGEIDARVSAWKGLRKLVIIGGTVFGYIVNNVHDIFLHMNTFECFNSIEVNVIDCNINGGAFK
jgi:hypothetical protein